MRGILLAPPGAGKGTQGSRIARRYGVPHISSGELFRAEVARGSAVGRRVREYLLAGDLVPDEDVVELLLPPVLDAARTAGGYVLDGFPRTLGQAQAAGAAAQEAGLPAQFALHLAAPDDVLLARLLARAQDRPDDSAATIRHRLDVYAGQTSPLLDYYAARGILHTVDATPPPDEVSAAVFALLDPLR